MLATKRRFEPSVIDRLFKEPYRFEYCQSVRLLEIWFRQQGAPSQNVVTDVLRFKNSLSLSFPASEIESLKTDTKNDASSAKELMTLFKNEEFKHVEITPAFMGMLGVSGALPLHYTERIAEHFQVERENGPRAFLDIFSNRALGLFYEAWRKYKLELKYEKTQKDNFLPLLLSLTGIGQASLKNRLEDQDGGVLDESMAYFAAALRHKPVSTAMMQKVIGAYFGAPMKIEQFVGAWYSLPPEQQMQLGSEGAVLGVGAVIGERIWQRDLCMKISIGPLPASKFEAFLPGKAAAKSLEKVLTMFTGLTIEYEVQLILRKEDVKPSELSQEGSSVNLGWNSFLTTEKAQEDSSEVRYRIHAPEITI